MRIRALSAKPIRSGRRALAARIQNGSRVFCKKIARFIMIVHKERLRVSFIRVFSWSRFSANRGARPTLMPEEPKKVD